MSKTKAKKEKTPFRAWLDREGLTIPQFVELARTRGVPVAKVNSAYKWARGAVPRNLVLFEAAFAGIKF